MKNEHDRARFSFFGRRIAVISRWSRLLSQPFLFAVELEAIVSDDEIGSVVQCSYIEGRGES